MRSSTSIAFLNTDVRALTVTGLATDFEKRDGPFGTQRGMERVLPPYETEKHKDASQLSECCEGKPTRMSARAGPAPCLLPKWEASNLSPATNGTLKPTRT